MNHEPGTSTGPSHLPRKRGSFVVIVGPDGAGKTSVARSLVDRFEGPTGYFHFRPPVRGPLEARPPDSSMPAPDKGTRQNSPLRLLLGWVRLTRNFLWFWLAYLVTVRPALRRGTLVVADRWAYGYVTQPYALKYHGPRWLAAMAIRAMPRPDLVVLLVAPPEVIHGRKQELSLAEIGAELERWERTSLPRRLRLDAGRPVDELADTIRERL